MAKSSSKTGSVAATIGLFVFFADLLTKYFTHLHIPLRTYSTYKYPYLGIGVLKNFFGVEFSIVHATNKGAAWGILAEFQTPLLIFRILLVLGMIIYLLFYNKQKSWEIPFALVIVGALGNVLDYFLYGHVVDMLHFVLWGYDFPVFNIADSSIFIGISCLFLMSLSEQKKVKVKSR